MKRYLVYAILTILLAIQLCSIGFAKVEMENQEEGLFGVSAGELVREGEYFTWTIEHDEITEVVAVWGEDLGQQADFHKLIQLDDCVNLEVEKHGMLAILLDKDSNNPVMLILNLPNIKLKEINLQFDYSNGKYVITNKEVSRTDLCFSVRNTELERLLEEHHGGFVFYFDEIQIQLPIQ